MPKAAGMPTIVCTMPVTTLPRVEKFARQYDINVAIHNHGTEDKIFPSPYDVLKHVKNMDPHMGLCIDIGHTARTGADVAVGITGIAGPGGGTPKKPVGTVVIAVIVPDQSAYVRTYSFIGGRTMVKFQSTQAAMDRVRRLLS